VLFVLLKIFRIEKRVEERKRKWEEDVENELKQQREAAIFKARPARVLEEKPFVSIKKVLLCGTSAIRDLPIF
jgi:hypothetical protein